MLKSCVAVALAIELFCVAACTKSPRTTEVANINDAAALGLCVVQFWQSRLEIIPLDRPQLIWEVKGAKPDYQQGRVALDGSFAVIVPAFEHRVSAIRLDGEVVWELKINRPGIPSISSDGKKIALASAGRLNVYDVPAARLDVLDVEGENPAWSPNNGRLAYDRDGKVYIYDPETGVSTEIGLGTEPSWAPDGESIAARAGYDTVDLIEIKSRARTTLLEGRGVSVPRWSPNGEWMIYTWFAGGRWWSIDDIATEPHHIVLRNAKTSAEAVVGRFLKANRGDFTWTTNPALCKKAP
jgi:hypothetical protein